jgi:hypothetical protein
MENQISPVSARVAAAVKVLELAVKTVKIDDLAERLAALEQRFSELGEPQ